jgi:hypothetical protein
MVANTTGHHGNPEILKIMVQTNELPTRPSVAQVGVMSIGEQALRSYHPLAILLVLFDNLSKKMTS